MAGTSGGGGPGGGMGGPAIGDGVLARLGQPPFLTPSGLIDFGFGLGLGQGRAVEGVPGGIDRDDARILADASFSNDILVTRMSPWGDKTFPPWGDTLNSDR